MEITVETITERRAQLLADYSAIGGAIQDCDYWLGVLEGEATPPDPDPLEKEQDVTTTV